MKSLTESLKASSKDAPLFQIIFKYCCEALNEAAIDSEHLLAEVSWKSNEIKLRTKTQLLSSWNEDTRPTPRKWRAIRRRCYLEISKFNIQRRGRRAE
ncbi:hypothetical protein EVAR_81155_1 [Eumeta japonica]|uniref:Uncharacterized protein n=1 Tax=Eumeta variegata TaxID=151549 RepID=A0A4C1UKW1_EUMVA|nr:hypothetical protein EVAR_81155_1 [Eumeta japonica]